MSEVLTPNFVLEINRKLDEIFYEVQVAREAVIPSSIRIFCESIITESLTIRKKEWELREQVNVNEDYDIGRAISTIEISLRNIFYNIEVEKSDYGESLHYISLHSFVREIQSKWCEIFPFC
nr:hypothetical protein [Allomuricauda sp.]